jgi:hypothetical protein
MTPKADEENEVMKVKMRTDRVVRTMAALAGAAVLLAACGSSTESGIEELIEQQSGGEVEIDLEDGEIKVQTEDGEFSLDIDEDDGSFSVEVDGEEVLSGDVDDEGDGSLTIEGEDGDSAFEIDSDGSIPDEWPGDVPEPEGLAIDTSSAFTSGDQVTVSITGTTDDAEAFADAYGGQLENAGLPQTSSLVQGDNITLFHENESWFVTIFGAPFEGSWQVTVSVISAG